MDIFWSDFVREKYAPGWEWMVRSVKKLFILREKKEWEYWLPIGEIFGEWSGLN